MGVFEVTQIACSLWILVTCALTKQSSHAHPGNMRQALDQTREVELQRKEKLAHSSSLCVHVLAHPPSDVSSVMLSEEEHCPKTSLW